MNSEESNIFSIKAHKTKYSKFGNGLEKLFKNNSLDFLQSKLKNPRYYKFKDEKIDELSIKQKEIVNMDNVVSSLFGKQTTNQSDYYLKGMLGNNFNLISQMNEVKKLHEKEADRKKKLISKNKLNKNEQKSEPEKELTLKDLLEINRKMR